MNLPIILLTVEAIKIITANLFSAHSNLFYALLVCPLNNTRSAHIIKSKKGCNKGDTMKYTKGPWEAHAIGSEGYNVARKLDDEIFALPVRQRLRAVQPICRVDGFDWETLKANALLISKAPTMYEALKQVQKIFGNSEVDTIEVEEIPVELINLVASALEGL